MTPQLYTLPFLHVSNFNSSLELPSRILSTKSGKQENVPTMETVGRPYDAVTGFLLRD